MNIENIKYNEKQIVKSADKLPTGYLRLETEFKYPDGDSVDVFIKEKNKNLVVTDLGQTINWLFSIKSKPILTDKQIMFVEHILNTYHVKRINGKLETTVNDNNISEAIFNLGQTCTILSHLMHLGADNK
jgi:hypothetical protein